MLNKVRGAALTARLNALIAERGIDSLKSNESKLPTVTILAPLAVLNRLAHSRADAMIGADLSFDERFETLGAMLPALSPTDLILPAMQGVSRR